MKFKVEHPYGYIEPAKSIEDAEDKLRESSDSGCIEQDPEDIWRYQEYREAGFNGPGMYFAGRIHTQES